MKEKMVGESESTQTKKLKRDSLLTFLLGEEKKGRSLSHVIDFLKHGTSRFKGKGKKQGVIIERRLTKQTGKEKSDES